MTVVLAIAVARRSPRGSSTSLARRPRGAAASRRPRPRRSRRRPRRRVARSPTCSGSTRSRARSTRRRRRPALDKRQAEIKALAERIAKGQEKIEAEVRRRGETDLQTRTLLEQMGQTVGNLNSETAGLKKALRQPQTRGQWGELQLRRCVEIAGMTEHVDFELQETLRTEDGQPAARRPLPAAGGPQLRRRLEGAARRLPRRPGGRGRIRAPGPPRAPRAAGARARPRAQLEGLPGPVQGRRDARPGDLLHPQRARPARRLRRRPRRSSTTRSSATCCWSARPR